MNTIFTIIFVNTRCRPETLTDEKLNQYFETFRHVTYGKIQTYHDTNISRKVAYVTFDTEDAVDKVLFKGAYHKFENVTVEVKLAVDKDKRQCDNGGWRLAHHQNYSSSGVNPNTAGIPPQPTYGYPYPPFYSSWLPYGPTNYNVGYNMNEFASGNAIFGGTAEDYCNPGDSNVGYARGILNVMPSVWGTQNPPEYMPNVQRRGG
ncbi:hypothetical protein POM88_002045 [Heracleum sosnowskyi]|uniref:RRM domain-containing protein n=1 Tax=Heracleum sosnowskyi TaxID=360622 RepID=A0AAD8JDE2_9APIA|nr:hypothetical protein POM88_002045 [Heracleum sosnowskyi]